LLGERLREILKGTSAEDLAEPLENLIRELIEWYEPLVVVIAGSLAKGKFVRGLSDLDILVIVDYPVRDEERFSLAPLNDVDVEITVVSREELEKAIVVGNEFYLDAVRNGRVVYAREGAALPVTL